MTHPNGLTTQYGTEGIWNRRQDTRCGNFGLIPSRPLDRNLPLRMISKKVTFYVLFSVQRLHGFRQVVQHVWEHVAIRIKSLIKSRKGHSCSGRKSKLVEDRYIVLWLSRSARKPGKTPRNKTTNKNRNKHSKKHPHQRAVTWPVPVYGWKDLKKHLVSSRNMHNDILCAI